MRGGRPPGPAYWLIANKEHGRIEVLTLDRDGQETLPVFGHEEETELFLQLGGVGDGWRVRETTTGELISMLYGPCAGVKEVALDPLPDMFADGSVGFVSLPRKRFVDCITARRRRSGSGPPDLHVNATGSGGARLTGPLLPTR